MKLSREEVEHIARLARLSLSEEEVLQYQQQLSAILEYAQVLQTVDTSGIAPTTSVQADASPLRPDLPGETLSEQDLFANAPDALKGQFKVPPVLENGT